MIVEDEANVRGFLREALESVEGYELFEAGDGVEAQNVLQQHRFDVVITDLIMPRMGGLELMQWAKDTCPGPAWIILSARGTFDDAIRAVQLGAFDFITKPLPILDSLLVVVRNALRQRRLSAERDRLHQAIEAKNVRLGQQVDHLKKACRLLLDQADVIGEDLRRAELIQRALLPRRIPDAPGFAINTVYRPCRSVGGDLYDVVRLDDRHLAFYIADAAGHGVSAAMLAVLFKHRLPLTQGQPPRPTPPAEVLGAVNRCLLDECTQPGLFITVAYCLLDTASAELVVASAGHRPLLLRHGDGTVQKIRHTGPALGLSADAEFSQTVLRLQPYQRLLLYTDGLHNALFEDDTDEFAEVRRLLGDMELPGQSLLEALLDMSAKAHGRAPQSDDIAALLLTAAAADSAIDNGEPVEARRDAAPVPQATTDVLIGTIADRRTICVRGRGTWISCGAFYEACLGEIEAHRPLTLDLSACEYLDSTFLGTIQELADLADRAGAALHIQGVGQAVMQLFEELGMSRVTRHIGPESGPLPGSMTPLSAHGAGDLQSHRILMAHETLASLSEQNRKEFIQFIEGMQREMAPSETSA